MGLKTTYYLRTLAASQIEKSTLDAGKFGFTQKRQQGETVTAAAVAAMGAANTTAAASLVEAAASLVEASAQVVYAAASAGHAGEVVVSPPMVSETFESAGAADAQPKLCRIDDPDCEACQ